MTTEIMPFSFEGLSVRVTDRNGEPWWVLADVCRVLEISNPSQAASRLDEDERHTLTNDEGIDMTDARVQALTVINESGLYSLILTSRKAAAKRFKRWVTAEVIPSIRKTGGYGASDPAAILRDPAALRSLLLEHAERELALQERVQALAPKAEALARIADAEGSLCVTDAAKALQLQPARLFSFLRERRWIYRRAGGKSDVAYQAFLQSGHLTHKVTVVERADGSEKTVEQVRVTSRGLVRLAELLGVNAQPVLSLPAPTNPLH